MAYTFQFNFFAFYKSLDKPSDEKMLLITKRSIGCVMCIYLLVAILGYVTFGSATAPKIIKNFNDDIDTFGPVMLAIINFSFMLLSALGFPLLFFNCRNFVVSVSLDIYMCFKSKPKRDDELGNINFESTHKTNIKSPEKINQEKLAEIRHERMSEAIEDNPEEIVNRKVSEKSQHSKHRLQSNDSGNKGQNQLTIKSDQMIDKEDNLGPLNEEDDEHEAGPMSSRSFNIMFKSISFLLLVILTLLAIFVSNFEDWISLVGGIAANGIAFILPSMFYLWSTKKKTGNTYRKLAIASFTLGIISLVLNVFSNIYKWLEPVKPELL